MGPQSAPEGRNVARRNITGCTTVVKLLSHFVPVRSYFFPEPQFRVQESGIACRTGTVGRVKMMGMGIGGSRKVESTYMYGADIAFGALFVAGYFQWQWGSGGSVGRGIDYNQNCEGGWPCALQCGKNFTNFRSEREEMVK